MSKSFPLLALFLIFSVLLSGCASQSPQIKANMQTLTAEQRSAQLLKNKVWRIKGKIAFIQKVKENKGKDKRQSASINWEINETEQTQTLNLTSFLGINVLNLESNKNKHLIKVNGKEYRGTNLPLLIYSLTGLTLPTKALNYWLKGLPYNSNDEIKIDEKTQLPISISSYFHHSLWQINSSNYRSFHGIDMATKFTIKKDGLLIKIAVNSWSFSD
ncbi:MAG: outer membrane lipoprotein LolB [Colwellia sp.]|nr:outer membrane lipoprotein LolB [Colwellia sp.]